MTGSVRYSRTLFGRVTHISADAIYANNINRKWCTQQKIITNFVRKGLPGKHEDQRKIMAHELSKERTIRMEGSFGTEKHHYSLYKIKSRTELNEILRIFYAVHMSNAVKIAKRLVLVKLKENIA